MKIIILSEKDIRESFDVKEVYSVEDLLGVNNIIGIIPDKESIKSDLEKVVYKRIFTTLTNRAMQLEEK